MTFALTPWLRVSDVARRLDVSPNAVYNAITRGELIANKFGRVIRISEEQLEAYRKRTETAGAA